MYIELFLLENACMDWLILRLAAALGGSRLQGMRGLCFSMLGAAYALLAFYWPAAGSPVGKGLFGCFLALALGPKTKKAYITATLCVFAAAFALGGMAAALAFATGGRLAQGAIWGGISLRKALCIALLGAFAPRGIRHLLRRRQAGRVEVLVLQGEGRYRLSALIDSGNSLFDPLTGLPVIVAYLPALADAAKRPIPAQTVGGPSVLWALERPRIFINGQEAQACLALSPNPICGGDAIVPPGALPISTGA